MSEGEVAASARGEPDDPFLLYDARTGAGGRRRSLDAANHRAPRTNQIRSARGQGGSHESSMAEVICSEAIWRVVDRSMQILGGLGITDDTIVARLFREVRPFRIYDGP